MNFGLNDAVIRSQIEAQICWLEDDPIGQIVPGIQFIAGLNSNII